MYIHTLDWRPADGELYPEVLELAGDELLFLASDLSPAPLAFPFRKGLLGACLSKCDKLSTIQEVNVKGIVLLDCNHWCTGDILYLGQVFIYNLADCHYR